MMHKCGEKIVLCVALVLVSVHALGQDKKIYRWVDENNVVHFGDAMPDNAQNVESRTLRPSPQPSTPPVRAPAVEPTAAMATTKPVQPASKAALVERVDTRQLSLAELDQRCDGAREKKIAPLRTAEIARCKAEKRNDPNWCERFNANYGDGGRTQSGTFRPRMFDDLPECAKAQSERHRRPR